MTNQYFTLLSPYRITFRREGTTEEQDNLARLESESSGSGEELVGGIKTQQLVKNLAQAVSIAMYSKDGKLVEKRSKIYHPSKHLNTKPLTTSTKRSTNNKTSTIANNTNKAYTKKTNNRRSIDAAVVRSVEDKYHIKPNFGMHIKCKVPGKSEKLKGTLEYLGHIHNLPKKSNVIVAGLQLDSDEDLGTDGTFLGNRYFTTKQKRGYFVPFKNCIPI